MKIDSILIASENYYPVGGGIQQYIRGIARELTARGYKITILTQCYDKPATVEMEEGTVYYSPLMTGSMAKPFQVMKRYKEFAGFIKENNIDLVYANNHNSLAMIKAARYAGVPVVYQCHGVGLMCPLKIRFLKPDDAICYNECGYLACSGCYAGKLSGRGKITGLAGYPSFWQQVKRYLNAQRILADADARIGNSGLCASLFRKQEMTFGVPLGIDADDYQPTDSAVFRDKFNIKNDYILVPGRLNNIKGQEYAVRALEHLSSDIKLVLAGNASLFDTKPANLGWYGARIKDIIKSQGLENRVIFTGFLDKGEMLQAYSGARVTVVPSVWLETFGYITIESFCCGTPVVVTGNCGSAECVDDTCGRIIERKNPQAIADAVNDIWDKSEKMGQAGREKMIRELNWQITADKILDIFTRVMAKDKGI
ncbi:glycosyltransferase family 4 protein [Chloroflexota bacterium]